MSARQKTFKEEHSLGASLLKAVVLVHAQLRSIPPLSDIHFVPMLGSCLFIEKREAEAQRIRHKYPDRIPVCLFVL